MRTSLVLLGGSSAVLFLSQCTFDTQPSATSADGVTPPRVAAELPPASQAVASPPRAPAAVPPIHRADGGPTHIASPMRAKDASVARAAARDEDAGAPVMAPRVSDAAVPFAGASAPVGPLPDAGSGTERPGMEPAGDVTCRGARVSGLCWYLGAAGESCTDACTLHGGFAAEMTEIVGTTAQGGSLAECARVMNALGRPGPLFPAARPDKQALGCHVWEDDATYWLDDADAPFDPHLRPEPWRVRIACACAR